MAIRSAGWRWLAGIDLKSPALNILVEAGDAENLACGKLVQTILSDR